MTAFSTGPASVVSATSSRAVHGGRKDLAAHLDRASLGEAVADLVDERHGDAEPQGMDLGQHAVPRDAVLRVQR